MRATRTLSLLIIVGLAISPGDHATAQTPQPTGHIQYTYDAVGNRVMREVITIIQSKTAPDSTSVPVVREESAEEAGDPAQGAEVFESALGGSAVKIFPNPVTEALTVAIEGEEEGSRAEIRVYDLGGKLLERVDHAGATTPIRFQSYSTGTYVLRIRIDNESKEWLVVKK